MWTMSINRLLNYVSTISSRLQCSESRQACNEVIGAGECMYVCNECVCLMRLKVISIHDMVLYESLMDAAPLWDVDRNGCNLCRC